MGGRSGEWASSAAYPSSRCSRAIQHWEPGAAGASCTSASRLTTSAWTRCCAPATGSTPSSPPTRTAPARRTCCSAARCAGVPRESYCLVGAVGHDFYEGEREGAKGFPRFTDPALRGAGRVRRLPADGDRAQPRALRRRALRRAAAPQPRPHRLPQPGGVGGNGGGARGGPVRALGVAPGPANGFTLDVIDCLERFGEIIDWAMVILNPMEPWPGQLVLAAAPRTTCGVITRVVDYGGLFWDDVRPGHAFAESDHRLFRPDGWIEAGRARLERMRPIAERHGLTPLQLSCAWNLAQQPVACVAPTLIQEPGDAEAIEDEARGARGGPEEVVLSAEEVEELRAIGDNTGSMVLKGASPDHDGPASRTGGRSTTSSRSSPRAGPSTPRATSSRPREARAARRRARAAGLRARGPGRLCESDHAGVPPGHLGSCRATGRARDVHRPTGLRRARRRDHVHDRVGRRVELGGDGRRGRCELAHLRVAQLRARRQLPRRRLVDEHPDGHYHDGLAQPGGGRRHRHPDHATASALADRCAVHRQRRADHSDPGRTGAPAVPCADRLGRRHGRHRHRDGPWRRALGRRPAHVGTSRCAADGSSSR